MNVAKVFGKLIHRPDFPLQGLLIFPGSSGSLLKQLGSFVGKKLAFDLCNVIPLTPINTACLFFGKGQFFCLEGTFKIAAPIGNEIELQMAEVYTVENGKIQNIRVNYDANYDAEEFRKEFGN